MLRFFTFTDENNARIDAGKKTQTRRLATPARRQFRPGIYDRCDKTRIVQLTEGRALVEYLLSLTPTGEVAVTTATAWVEISPKAAARIRTRKDPYARQPAMFILSELALRQVRLISVREEPLGAISEADAIAEGVQRREDGWRDYTDPAIVLGSARESFASLWDSIHGPGAFAGQRDAAVLAFEFEPLDAVAAIA